MRTLTGEGALGLIEVEGVAGIIAGADAALKGATVDLLGWDSIGGYTTVFVSGSVSDVQAAVRAGEAAARTLVEHVVAATVTRPGPVCRRYVTRPAHPDARNPSGALGLLEARGYGIQIEACDRMIKAAAVDLVDVLTVHNRVVCVLVTGDVGAVREAVAVGRDTMAQYVHFLCDCVIPQPAPGLFGAFVASPARAEG